MFNEEDEKMRPLLTSSSRPVCGSKAGSRDRRLQPLASHQLQSRSRNNTLDILTFLPSLLIVRRGSREDGSPAESSISPISGKTMATKSRKLSPLSLTSDPCVRVLCVFAQQCLPSLCCCRQLANGRHCQDLSCQRFLSLWSAGLQLHFPRPERREHTERPRVRHPYLSL